MLNFYFPAVPGLLSGSQLQSSFSKAVTRFGNGKGLSVFGEHSFPWENLFFKDVQINLGRLSSPFKDIIDGGH